MLIGLMDNPEESTITVGGKGLLASIDPEMLERFGDALFVPMVVLIVGPKVAPRFKFQTGIVLSILWGILLGAALTLALTNVGFQWKIVIAAVLGAVGVAIGLGAAHKEGAKVPL